MDTTFRQFAPALALTVAILLGNSPLQAADTVAPTAGTAWDATVNALLATGMYGVSSTLPEGVTIHLQKADAFLPGLPYTHSPLNAQAITFSYEGSSGLLAFSAGYILSHDPAENQPPSVYLDIEPKSEALSLDPERSLYLALDLSRSYQIDDDFALSFGNRALLIKNPFDTQDSHLFSLLFSIPITYKNYLTITPELQWTRPLFPNSAGPSSNASSYSDDTTKDDVFYGGVSIRFSY